LKPIITITLRRLHRLI